ncbi:hypothetical protein [Kutzneria sp. NPDC052558]|uniref:hypothetical protein n=1 Tax=Kutzneria sp. NPDC052558 TaxID=3364121 RepID=UPI0037C747DE
MAVEGDPGLKPGLWLVRVKLDDMAGLTVVEVGEDNSVRALGPGRGVYLFPTRRGMADFLASGEWHSLQGRLDGFDAVTADLRFGANFVLLRDTDDMNEEMAAAIWMVCLLIVDACGIAEPATVEAAAVQVAALAKLRDDFEQPAYADADYWIYQIAKPVRLTLPSGAGVTLCVPIAPGYREPESQAFLGDSGEVVLFQSPEELLAYIRADGTDEMRQASWWPVDPPNCEPQMSVDIRLADPRDQLADPHDPTTWAFAFLRALAATLTGRDDLADVRARSKRQLRKASERIADVLREVNGKVTWR